jgi:uncharacterized membrane protein
MFHVTGAFLFIGGSVAAAALSLLALRAPRPSDTALLLRLIRATLPILGLGMLLTIVLGLWLVHEQGYAFGSFWVIAALVLWVLSGWLGSEGGRHQQRARELAERLAAEGDAPSAELRALLRDARGNALSWLAGLAALLLLVDMFWKPGA